MEGVALGLFLVSAQVCSVVVLSLVALLPVWNVRAVLAWYILTALILAYPMAYFLFGRLGLTPDTKPLFGSFYGASLGLGVIGVLLGIFAYLTRWEPIFWVPLLVAAAYVLGYVVSGFVAVLLSSFLSLR